MVSAATAGGTTLLAGFETELGLGLVGLVLSLDVDVEVVEEGRREKKRIKYTITAITMPATAAHTHMDV
jgi:hypothetical protein